MIVGSKVILLLTTTSNLKETTMAFQTRHGMAKSGVPANSRRENRFSSESSSAATIRHDHYTRRGPTIPARPPVAKDYGRRGQAKTDPYTHFQRETRVPVEEIPEQRLLPARRNHTPKPRGPDRFRLVFDFAEPNLTGVALRQRRDSVPSAEDPWTIVPVSHVDNRIWVDVPREKERQHIAGNREDGTSRRIAQTVRQTSGPEKSTFGCFCFRRNTKKT